MWETAVLHLLNRPDSKRRARERGERGFETVLIGELMTGTRKRAGFALRLKRFPTSPWGCVRVGDSGGNRELALAAALSARLGWSSGRREPPGFRSGSWPILSNSLRLSVSTLADLTGGFDWHSIFEPPSERMPSGPYIMDALGVTSEDPNESRCATRAKKNSSAGSKTVLLLLPRDSEGGLLRDSLWWCEPAFPQLAVVVDTYRTVR